MRATEFVCSITLLSCIYFGISGADWVEIPQLASESAFTRRPDLYTTFVTTTSTKTPVTMIPKPHVKQRNNFSNFTTITHIKSTSAEPSRTKAKKAEYSTTTIRKDTGDGIDIENSNDIDCDEPIISKQEVEDHHNFSTFLPFLTTVQSTLMRNAHRDVGSKVYVLQNLKSNMLFEIEDRIAELWQPIDSQRSKREAREYKEESHMEFPSNEGALMTIGFLTFGVFLIKLIIHLVNAVKNKPTMMTMGRKKRFIDLNKELEILNQIAEYNPN